MPPEIDPKVTPEKTDPAKELESFKNENEALKAKIAEFEKKAKPAPDDLDLKEKARLAAEKDLKEKGDTKSLENALRFSMGSKDFVKSNEAHLPKEVGDIFAQAEKENYSNAIEKDQAIKSGIIQSFFQVQENVDLLTPGVKSQLDDYLKLTKTGKQDKAQAVYDTIFEPALEMRKRLKKAEALSKGYGGSSDDETAYKNKLMTLSKKHYFGEK